MLLSGGIDSATCLYLARRKGYQNRALTILFNRIADGEVSSARRVAESAGVTDHRFVEIPGLKEAGDMESSGTFGGLPRTYIPARNMIFYSVASSYAEEVGANYIIGGHNKDDAQSFEDARREFFGELQKVVWASSRRLRESRTTILTPLQHKTKPEVISLGVILQVPFELTWSCDREGTAPCMKCEGCRKRREAFATAGVKDPLENARFQTNV